MAVRQYRDLVVWQLAEGFKLEVYGLVLRCSRTSAASDFHRDQILNAASAVSKDICEGFLRKSPSTFVWFLDCGIASLGEADSWLADGIERGYFPLADCEKAFTLARRCLTGMIRLKRSQQRYADMQRGKRPRR